MLIIYIDMLIIIFLKLFLFRVGLVDNIFSNYCLYLILFEIIIYFGKWLKYKNMYNFKYIYVSNLSRVFILNFKLIVEVYFIFVVLFNLFLFKRM